MKSMLILALHGNPGAVQDFHDLRVQLNLPGVCHVVPHSRPRGGAGLDELKASIDDSLRRARREKLVVIGFSWGGYLALQWARTATPKPDLIILVNPTLAATSSVSAGVRLVVNLPLVGRFLVGRGLEERVAQFTDAMFAPEKAGDEIRGRLAQDLADPDLWLGAARYKALQEDEPLPPLEAMPAGAVVVVRGGADGVAGWEKQREVLNGIEKDIRVEVIKGAGHSLLWTHGKEVAATIRQALDAL